MEFDVKMILYMSYICLKFVLYYAPNMVTTTQKPTNITPIAGKL